MHLELLQRLQNGTWRFGIRYSITAAIRRNRHGVSTRLTDARMDSNVQVPTRRRYTNRITIVGRDATNGVLILPRCAELQGATAAEPSTYVEPRRATSGQ